MKKADVQIGATYTAKISNRVVQVLIGDANPRGGWYAINLATGKRVQIKSAQRLRGTVQAPRPPRAPRRPEPAPVAEPSPVATQEPQQATVATTGRRLGLLGAASKVLARNNYPMNARKMVEEVAASGLWSSPAGRTPHATLYSAIIREIAQKGEESRFRKVARGQFEAKTTNAE